MVAYVCLIVNVYVLYISMSNMAYFSPYLALFNGFLGFLADFCYFLDTYTGK